MTRTLYSRRDQERVEEIVDDWERADAPVFYRLTIAGVPYTDRLLSCELSSSGDSPAISLDATLDGRLPQELDNAPAVVWAEFDGIRVPRLSGVVSRASRASDGFSTEFLSASPGALLDKVALRPPSGGKNLTEFAGTSHDRVLQKAVQRVTGRGGYRAGGVLVPPFGRSLANYAGSNGFEDQAKVKDVLDKVASEVMCVYRDGPDRSFEALANPRTGKGRPVAYSYSVGSREVLAWTSPVLAAPDEQYTEVIVRERHDSGAYTVYAESAVSHYANPYPPFPGQTFYVAWSDTTANKHSSAAQTARDAADEFSRPAHNGTPVVSYNPLIERGDVLRFTEERRDDAGFWRFLWRAVVDGWADVLDENGLATRLTCRFYLLSKTRLAEPEARLAGVAAGTASPGNLRPLYGRDGMGAFFNTDLPWVRYDEATKELVFDPAVAATYGVTVRYDETTREVVVTG